jgi:Protein of unknown function (DUF3037)
MKRMGASYSVIRYIPDIFREEFVNVGVALFCPEAGYYQLQVIDRFGRGSKAQLLADSNATFVRQALADLKDGLTAFIDTDKKSYGEFGADGLRVLQ